MKPLKNAQWEKMALAMAGGMDVGLAYEASGYKARGNAAQVNGCRLLRNPEIQARIDELKTRHVEVVQARDALDRQWVVERLMRNAAIAMGEEKVKLTLNQKGTDTPIEIEVSMRDAAAANQALQLLGKELGMFVERTENRNVNIDITDTLPSEADWEREHATPH